MPHTSYIAEYRQRQREEELRQRRRRKLQDLRELRELCLAFCAAVFILTVAMLVLVYCN